MTPDPRTARRSRSRFGAVQALYEVDFHVASGEVMALVGDNGAGKSTLIKCIAGIHPIDGGEILFEGKPVQHPRAEGRRRPRHRGRLPGPRARRQPRRGPEHVPRPRGAQLAAAPRRDRDGEAGVARRSKSLSVTTITSVRQTVAGLSGGQRQSVAVAKAVMWNSRVVILDEPTAALGVAQTRQVLDLVKRLGEQGLAVDPDLPQPARHLRGRRHDHGAAPRPERRRVQAHARPTSRRSSRRSPPASCPRCPARAARSIA